MLVPGSLDGGVEGSTNEGSTNEGSTTLESTTELLVTVESTVTSLPCSTVVCVTGGGPGRLLT